MVLEEIDAVECFLQFRQVDGALRPIVSLAAQVGWDRVYSTSFPYSNVCIRGR